MYDLRVIVVTVSCDTTAQYSDMHCSKLRKWWCEFRAVQKTCKMRSVCNNQIRAKEENNDTCKSVINTQQGGCIPLKPK